jgi:hypothetical protein
VASGSLFLSPCLLFLSPSSSPCPSQSGSASPSLYLSRTSSAAAHRRPPPPLPPSSLSLPLSPHVPAQLGGLDEAATHQVASGVGGSAAHGSRASITGSRASPCPLHTASPRQPRRIQPRLWWFGPQPWWILRIWPQPWRLRRLAARASRYSASTSTAWLHLCLFHSAIDYLSHRMLLASIRFPWAVPRDALLRFVQEGGCAGCFFFFQIHSSMWLCNLRIPLTSLLFAF